MTVQSRPPATPRPTSNVQRVWAWAVRHRWWVLAGWTAVWTAVCVARPHGFGWHYFVTGARQLTSPHALHLFVDHPELQTGPVSVAAVVPLVRGLPAGAALDVAMVAMAAAGLLGLALVERLVQPGRVHEAPVTDRGAVRSLAAASPGLGSAAGRALVVGLLVVPVWAQVAVVWSHPDDVIAVVCAVAALLQLHRDRPLVAAVLLGLAVDAKPWALVFIPLLLIDQRPRRRVVAVAVAAVVVLAVWLPFVLAAPATLTAADFTIPVSPQSVLHLIGVRGRTPSWCRTAQLVLGLAVAATAVLRHRWQYALLAGVAARMLLDPAAKPYYAAAAVIAAAIADLAFSLVFDRGAGADRHRWPLPWRTAAVFVGLFAVPLALGDTSIGATTAGIVRAVVLLAALAAPLAAQSRDLLQTIPQRHLT